MSKFLGRVSGWAVTNPTPTIAGVLGLIAILVVVAALRLSPDAGTDKLVDSGSAAFEETQEYRDRFGDDAIVVLARGELSNLVLTENLGVLLALEGCLAGNAVPAAELPEGAAVLPDVCFEIAELDAVRGVFGPATFLNTAATQTTAFVQTLMADLQAQAQTAAEQARAAAAAEGFSPEQQAAAADAAGQEILLGAISQYGELAAQIGGISGASLNNPQFVSSIVFDSARGAQSTPKSRFGYLFAPDGGLISLRLEPEISDETRHDAIALIRAAVSEDAFALDGGSYEVSGVPVVVEGLAEELGGELIILLALAIVVMALTLLLLFGPPLRLLPLLIALGAAGVAFGLLGIAGGSLTMASVAVLPIVIGLGVDYAIQLQARFREAVDDGRRPAAAAVFAAVRGGPVIATAAAATAAGFLVLLLSPIPMVREFALALVVGVIAALAIALTAGLAVLSLTRPPSPGERVGSRLGPPDAALRFVTYLRGRVAAVGGRTIGLAIAAPGRVLLVAAVLAASGWIVGTKAEVVSDIRELVPADLPALESLDAVEEVTGVASAELNVLVRGDNVTSPEAITWMRDFKERVLAQHGYSGDMATCRDDDVELCPGPAISDLFTGAASPDANRIDGVLAVVPPYFLEAILSVEEGAQQVASIGFLLPLMPLDEQEALIEEIRAEIDPPEGISAEIVGLPVLAAEANAELSGSRHWLALAGLLAVALVLLAVYRSPARALVPLIPIALATGWSALILSLLGVPLNPMSATLGALVIAIATEFSVILSARFREEREAGSSVGEALRLTYARTGAAVFASAITSVAGFGVLIASEITMLRDFGLVTVVDLLVALLGVTIVLPAALVWAESGFSPFSELLRRRRDRAGRAEPLSSGGVD